MLAEVEKSHSIVLPTGVLSLTVTSGPDLAELCDFAARANPKRGFLVVSKILGRHLPAQPAAMRRSMRQLAAMLPVDLPQPVVFLGMAETATALGQGVFAAYGALQPDRRALYLQTSRQVVPDATLIASFEEGHSHATTHLVQIRDDQLHQSLVSARTLVIVDDECSTGQTFVAAAAAMMTAMPNLERIETCCLTDWSGRAYFKAMPVTPQAHALLDGIMDWQVTASAPTVALAGGVNRPGLAPASGMRSRSGLYAPEAAIRPPLDVRPGERVLVLGDGEHSYEGLRIAEEIEAKGGIAAVQCITRSPALLGHAMQSVSRFDDAYGSGAACYLYNILAHRPDRVIIAAEIVANQAAMAREALAQLGVDLPVELVHCRYDMAGSPS